MTCCPGTSTGYAGACGTQASLSASPPAAVCRCTVRHVVDFDADLRCVTCRALALHGVLMSAVSPGRILQCFGVAALVLGARVVPGQTLQRSVIYVAPIAAPPGIESAEDLEPIDPLAVMAAVAQVGETVALALGAAGESVPSVPWNELGLAHRAIDPADAYDEERGRYVVDLDGGHTLTYTASRSATLRRCSPATMSQARPSLSWSPPRGGCRHGGRRGGPRDGPGPPARRAPTRRRPSRSSPAPRCST